MLYLKERSLMVQMGKQLLASNLVEGSGGNLSICVERKKSFLITPSGMNYQEVLPEDILLMGWDGDVLTGNHKPSSEWELHRRAYDVQIEAWGAVHTHSPYATAYSCLGTDLPPVHYLIAYAGAFVPRVPYALFGSSELAEKAAQGLLRSRAVLLENHGVLAVGSSLERAYHTAAAVEYVAKIYHLASTLGVPRLLSKDEIALVEKRMLSYGSDILPLPKED